MSNYVKLLNNLEELSLNNIKLNLDKYIEMINSHEKSLVDALYEL
ncbi:transposase, partial [Terrisporobacter petrolearius]|nr:transposase [Terrisporobacter petrolearius]MCC3866570.1 transposase [Terrisporobacter petrolearius]